VGCGAVTRTRELDGAMATAALLLLYFYTHGEVRKWTERI
jgi:uncharacterized protein (TIGR03382 family)